MRIVQWSIKQKIYIYQNQRQDPLHYHGQNLTLPHMGLTAVLYAVCRLCIIKMCQLLYSHFPLLRLIIRNGNQFTRRWFGKKVDNKSKPDGVGPVDNRPSTDKLHLFVPKKKWHMTCDTWHVHVTCDMWHVTRDMWHVTRLGGGEHSLKISAP